MNCCCPHSNSANRLFSFFARRYRRRFEKRGFESSQKQLLEGLQRAGYTDSRILEIGSGVGHLHQTLLERGARSAVGVDLAARMIEEARHWAEQRNLAARTSYVEGDFMEIHAAFAEADVTILDKVVCCYPDANGMIHASLGKTRRVYALTYPRDRWYVRMMMGLAAGLMKIARSSFRPYVHDPAQIERWITHAGFEKTYERNTLVWLTRVFVRA